MMSQGDARPSADTVLIRAPRAMKGHSFARPAHRWLLESGIRGIDDDRGALRRQYDTRLCSYADCYPEVTAYALQLHLRLAGDDRQGVDWQAAIDSGEWLLSCQSGANDSTQGAYAHAVRNGQPSGGWYTFDTAIIGHAMLELAQAAQRPEFGRCAERCAQWVLEQQNADGTFRAQIGATHPVVWAGDRCCLHGKHAVLLSAFWHHSGETRYRNSAVRLLDWIIDQQRPDGRIDAFAGADYAMLHTQCYAIEGLLAGAMGLAHHRALEAASRGAVHLARCQRSSGALPRYVGGGARQHLKEGVARFTRLRALIAPSDVGVTAQAIRVWSWAQQVCGNDHAEAIQRGMAWLSRQQLLSGDPNVDGAFPAGVDEWLGLRRRERWLYPWASVFAIDACRMRDGPDAAPSIF